MQPILIGSASEKETLRSNFPEDLECLMTATSDEELLLVFFVVVATVEAVDVVVRTLERTWMKGRIVPILTPKEFDPKENFIPTYFSPLNNSVGWNKSVVWENLEN